MKRLKVGNVIYINKIIQNLWKKIKDGDYCARIISKKICAHTVNEINHFFLVYSFYLVDSIFNSFSRTEVHLLSSSTDSE